MTRRRVHLPAAGVAVTLEFRKSRGHWRLNWQHDGRRHRRKLAATLGASIDAADEFVCRLLDRGTADSPPMKLVGAEMLLTKRKLGLASGTSTAMKSHLRRHILPGLGAETPVGSVTAQDLRDFRMALLEADIALKTGNRILSTLRQTLLFAQERGYCPMPDFPRRFPENPADNAGCWTIVSPEDLSRLSEYIAPEYRAALAYLMNTGIRVSSALSTRESWIDFDRQLVRYPRGAVKQGRPFTQVLNEDALEALEVGLASSEDDRPFPISYWSLRRAFVAACDEAGVPHVTIKDLRHSMVSNLLDRGVPIHVVRDLMGHSSIHVTSLYAHARDDAKVAALARVRAPARLVAVAPSGPKRGPRGTKRRIPRGGSEPEGTEIAGDSVVGHLGLEPRANGLRIHCSTN